MKILMISSYLPYPLFSGGQVRLFNLIKELSSRHEITLICEKRHHQTDVDVKEVEEICKQVITVDRRKQWSVSNILKSGVSTQSFLINGHTLSEMQEKIKGILSINSFDLIHVETFYVMQNLPSVSLPVVLVEHNIEYKVYQKFMDRAPFIFRPLLSVDIAKIKREEEQVWQKATALVAVSEDDRLVMKQKGVDSAVVPNGVNTNQFSFKNSKKLEREKKILFIGDFSWIQNKDAVTFIIKEIWPEILNELRIKNPELRIKLWIVGRKISDSIRSLTNDSTVFFDQEGSARSTPEIFQEADILLAPLRVGGGTSYKILEAMSCGTPVVTMQMSADAIRAKDRQEVMIGKNAKELAEKTISLLNDINMYEHVRRNGRELVEKHYTWKAIAKMLEEVYIKTIKSFPM